MKINQNNRFNIDLSEYYATLKVLAEAGEWKAYWKLARCTVSAAYSNIVCDYAYRTKVKAHKHIRAYSEELDVVRFKASVEKYSEQI